MKRVLGLLLVLGIMFAAIGGLTTARAATTDTFTITVTVNFIEMTLRNTTDNADYTTWAIPQMSLAASAPMADLSGVYVDLLTTNQAVDIKTWVSTQGDWTVQPAPGASQYSLIATGATAAEVPGWTGAASLGLSGAKQTIIPGATTALSHFLYYKFYSPITVGTGSQQSIEVTV